MHCDHDPTTLIHILGCAEGTRTIVDFTAYIPESAAPGYPEVIRGWKHAPVVLDSRRIRETARRRFEGRSYFFVVLDDGETFAVKVSELPPPVAKLFSPWGKRGKPYQSPMERRRLSERQVDALARGGDPSDTGEKFSVRDQWWVAT